jgi:hypothetical protein
MRKWNRYDENISYRPGKPKKSFFFPFISQVANVVGLPGFICNRPKWIVALNFSVKIDLIRSYKTFMISSKNLSFVWHTLSPIETPPVEITTSASSKADCNVWITDVSLE